MTIINLYTVKSDWHKTSPVQERLELSQFAIEEKQSYSNFQEIDSCTIDLKVSFVSVCASRSSVSNYPQPIFSDDYDALAKQCENTIRRRKRLLY